MRARVVDGDRIRTIEAESEEATAAEIRAFVATGAPIWVELGEQSVVANELLVDVFDLHPLTVEDIWASRSAPKLEDYRKYLYLIVHAIRSPNHNAFDLAELDIVIGKTFLITHEPTEGVTREVVAELERDPVPLARGSAWVAHLLIDRTVDRYLPVVDELDDGIEALTSDALARAGTPGGPAVLQRILAYKRLLQNLRRTTLQQREILVRVSRGEFEEIPRDTVPFFRDVHDHFLRINDTLETYREQVATALEAYLTVQSNRMNEVMKTLTMISTVMLPLTFIAGVYGMNFEHMPELSWLGGYPFALGLMAVIAVSILWWFRRKHWLGGAEADDVPGLKRPR